MRKKGREMQLRQWKKMRAVRQICERAGERGAEEGIGGEVRASNGRSGYDKGGGLGGREALGLVSQQCQLAMSNAQRLETGD